MRPLLKYLLPSRITSFFPVQVLIGHLKYNLISLFYWSFLFAIVSDSLGSAFGVPYLFFSPEYLGKVSTWSFLLLGIGVGGFTMAFNTYSYFKLGPRYRFLATVSRPFFKFCINNAIIPVFFIGFYLFRMASFQRTEEMAETGTIIIYALSFLAGFSIFILLSIFYFFPTTRDRNIKPGDEDHSENPIQSVIQGKERWYDYFRTEKERNYYYIGKGLRLYLSRSTAHLDKHIIEQVFAKNRINASIFEILTISSFFVFGFFKDFPFFEFPAAMSIVLLLTLLHMVFSAMMSWFHRWTYPILILAIITMNYLSTSTGMFRYTNFAYGLSYEDKDLRTYSVDEIRELVNDHDFEISSGNNYISILENWKRKTGEERPKLVILNTSGGGSRSALWTFSILENCNEQTTDKLSRHLHMMTGASGGMVGAAYFRELLLERKKGRLQDIYEPIYADNLGKDLLNKLSFSASTTDLFFRYQGFNYNNISYTKDRGYSFEEHLHENTDRLMDHPLGYYTQPEKKADIPVMIFSPTIVNDGRRLLISSQSLSFLTENKEGLSVISRSYENLDYQAFFRSNNPQKVRFSSVLRASATFPFIMPMITMPTIPEMQLMDAGIRDNYGGKTTVEFLSSLRDWIAENTSGVIILEIRDTKRILKNEYYERVSLLDKLSLPFGNMYNNFPRTQDFDQEQLISTVSSGFNFPVDVITFNLRENKSDRISLSWHLTSQEKQKIRRAIDSEENQKSLKRLIELLGK